MAITAALVTALSGGEIDYVPITPNTQNFEVTLPAGTWLVQIEVSNQTSSAKDTELAGATSRCPADGSNLITRIVQGGTHTGSTNSTKAAFTHGIAIRLGD